MSEPTTNPTSQPPPSRIPFTENRTRAAARVISPSEYDHNHQCVGCGAHFSDPCEPECPFETGRIRPSVVLRAAVGRLREHAAEPGYDIAAALRACAVVLVGFEAATHVADLSRQSLSGFLIYHENMQPGTEGDVQHFGRTRTLHDIAWALYATAAEDDELDIDYADPHPFGELPH